METLASKQVYADPWMAVREDAVRRQDGSTGRYTVVDSPDIAVIVAVDGDRLHLVEQYRYPVGARRWEFPAGTSDPTADGDAATTAARELREETGLVAGRLAPLGVLDVAPGQLSQRCHVFVATDLTEGPPQREVEEQDMRSGWFARADVARMIGDGTICDAKSVAAYALLLLGSSAPRTLAASVDVALQQGDLGQQRCGRLGHAAGGQVVGGGQAFVPLGSHDRPDLLLGEIAATHLCGTDAVRGSCDGAARPLAHGGVVVVGLGLRVGDRRQHGAQGPHQVAVALAQCGRQVVTQPASEVGHTGTLCPQRPTPQPSGLGLGLLLGRLLDGHGRARSQEVGEHRQRRPTRCPAR